MNMIFNLQMTFDTEKKILRSKSGYPVPIKVLTALVGRLSQSVLGKCS